MDRIDIARKKAALDTLFSTVAKLRQKDAAAVFIRQLLTEDEQETVGRRLLIAKMLLSGKTQAEVRAELGVSPNTFTRTRKWLTKEIPEYGAALAAHDREKKAKKPAKEWRERHQPFTLADLKRRYPAHFLLFNLADALMDRSRESKRR